MTQAELYVVYSYRMKDEIREFTTELSPETLRLALKDFNVNSSTQATLLVLLSLSNNQIHQNGIGWTWPTSLSHFIPLVVLSSFYSNLPTMSFLPCRNLLRSSRVLSLVSGFGPHQACMRADAIPKSRLLCRKPKFWNLPSIVKAENSLLTSRNME